jgi:hypothetical protein
MEDQPTWKKLSRAEHPLSSTVEMDEVTADLIRPFDYESDGTESFYPFLLPEDLLRTSASE